MWQTYSDVQNNSKLNYAIIHLLTQAQIRAGVASLDITIAESQQTEDVDERSGQLYYGFCSFYT